MAYAEASMLFLFFSFTYLLIPIDREKTKELLEMFPPTESDHAIEAPWRPYLVIPQIRGKEEKNTGNRRIQYTTGENPPGPYHAISFSTWP